MRYVVPLLARLFSALLALSLVAAGVIVVVEVAAARLGIGWTILPSDTVQKLRDRAWDDQAVVLTIVAVAVVGLVALLVGLWPRAPLTVPITGIPGASYERYALERSVTRRLEAVDGVTGARVRAGRRRVTARVDTNRRFRPDELRAEVESVLAQTVAERSVALSPRVRLRHPGGEQ